MHYNKFDIMRHHVYPYKNIIKDGEEHLYKISESDYYYKGWFKKKKMLKEKIYYKKEMRKFFMIKHNYTIIGDDDFKWLNL